MKTPDTAPALTNKRVLRLPAVLERTGLGATALQDAIDRDEFPAPISITDTGRTKAWLEEEIDDWLKERIKKRDAELAARKQQVA